MDNYKFPIIQPMFYTW